jgi:hypothetical protein
MEEKGEEVLESMFFTNVKVMEEEERLEMCQMMWAKETK